MQRRWQLWYRCKVLSSSKSGRTHGVSDHRCLICAVSPMYTLRACYSSHILFDNFFSLSKAEYIGPTSRAAALPVSPVGRKLQARLKCNQKDGCFQEGAQSPTCSSQPPSGGTWPCSLLSVWNSRHQGLKEHTVIQTHGLRFSDISLILGLWKEKQGNSIERNKSIFLHFLYQRETGEGGRKRGREKGERERGKRFFYFNTLLYNGVWIISSFFCHVFRCERTQWIIIAAVKGIYI